MSRLVRSTTEGQEALAAATAETLLQVRGVTTQKASLAYFRLSADQEATTEIENISWRLLYQSTDGTFTGATEVPGDPDDPTPALTMFHSSAGEPTPGTVIDEGEIPANGETFTYLADGDGIGLDNATTSRIGLEVTASVICNAKASWGWRIDAA